MISTKYINTIEYIDFIDICILGKILFDFIISTSSKNRT